MVTLFMQKMPCCALKNDDFVIWFWKKKKKIHSSDEAEERNRRAQEGEKDWEKRKGKGEEEGRNEARLDSQRLAAALLTIWVTPAAVFLWGEQKHLICHSFHFHSNTCKSFAFCQFCLFLSFLHVPLHFLNDNAVAISLAIHRPGLNITLIQSWENGKSLLQTCRFLSFFSPLAFLQHSSLSPTSHLGFPPATYPLNLLIKSRSLLSDPCETPHGSVAPLGPLSGSYVSPLHGNKWAQRSIVTVISYCCWERATTEPLLFHAHFIQNSSTTQLLKIR